MTRPTRTTLRKIKLEKEQGGAAPARPRTGATADKAPLIKGLFAGVLTAFRAEHGEPVAFLHIDCDLYFSTKTFFQALRPLIAPSCVTSSTNISTIPAGASTKTRRSRNSSAIAAEAPQATSALAAPIRRARRSSAARTAAGT